MNLGSWLRWHWDRAIAWLCVTVGAIALILGWVGVSGTGYPADQLPYIISGGVGGIFLLGLGAMLWLSADLRDEWLKLDRLEQKLQRIGETTHGSPPTAKFPANGSKTVPTKVGADELIVDSLAEDARVGTGAVHDGPSPTRPPTSRASKPRTAASRARGSAASTAKRGADESRPPPLSVPPDKRSS